MKFLKVGDKWIATFGWDGGPHTSEVLAERLCPSNKAAQARIIDGHGKRQETLAKLAGFENGPDTWIEIPEIDAELTIERLAR